MAKRRKKRKLGNLFTRILIPSVLVYGMFLLFMMFFSVVDPTKFLESVDFIKDVAYIGLIFLMMFTFSTIIMRSIDRLK